MNIRNNWKIQVTKGRYLNYFESVKYDFYLLLLVLSACKLPGCSYSVKHCFGSNFQLDMEDFILFHVILVQGSSRIKKNTKQKHVIMLLEIVITTV